MSISYFPQVLLVVLLAIMVGFQTGRLLTLWQLRPEQGDDERGDGETENQRPLDIAFMGRSARLTDIAFKMFIDANIDQINRISEQSVTMIDGTIIKKYYPARIKRFFDGVRIDQYILADFNGFIYEKCRKEIDILKHESSMSLIPPEFRCIYFDMDKP